MCPKPCVCMLRERERVMATDLFSSDHADEDYIDMEIGSHTSLFHHPRNSPPHPSEFEFQMFSSSSERETTSPADKLFYKGKLLPLHLPPRLQMVEKLLQKTDFYQNHQDTFDELFGTPLTTNVNTTPTTNTPFESCNISPTDSCQVSRELNPEKYFSEYSTEASELNGKNPKKSWTKNIGPKLTKQSCLGSKLKASCAYLKSLFSKSACTDESSTRNIRDEAVPKARESVSKYSNITKEVPFSQITKDTNQKSATGIRSFNKEKFATDNCGHHRRSFSGALKRLSTTKSSSSLFPSGSSTSSSQRNSNSFHGLPFHKTNSSGILEIENLIQGAIAHCKTSQQQFYPKNAINDAALCSLSTSNNLREDQERQVLCRG